MSKSGLDKKQDNSISREYSRLIRKKAILLISILILMLIVTAIAVFLGASDIRFSSLLASLFPNWGKSRGIMPLSTTDTKIIVSLRLPRIISAMLVGAGLGVCGTVMQSTTGNIMASPFTTGISSAAALGAAIGILFHPFGVGNISIMISAFAVGMINAAIVYGITAVGQLGAGGMILVGVALNFMFSSANSLLQYVASEDQLAQIVHWSFGSLTGVTWRQILIMAIIIITAFIFFQYKAWSYNVMSSGGDETAKALGINPSRTRISSGILVTIVAAVIISFVGVIGFVGLVAPHVARLIIGHEHRILIPASTIIGSILVLIADTIGRTIISPVIIPVGIVLSVVGAPLFLYLIISQRRRTG